MLKRGNSFSNSFSLLFFNPSPEGRNSIIIIEVQQAEDAERHWDVNLILFRQKEEGRGERG